MQKRKLGTTGFDIAPIVFGGNVFGWTADQDESFRILDAFVDHGFDAIDTADVYSAWAEGNKGGESETVLGNWLAARPGIRDKVKIFTKVGSDMGGTDAAGLPRKGLSERWIMQAVEDSLRRMKTDVIDLYFSHWPDDSVTHEETLSAYDKLLKAGKIRAIGASNYDAALLSAALKTADDKGLPRYQVLQPEYNLYDRAGFDGPLRDLCLRENIGVVTYFSLAAGFLSGKYRSKSDASGKMREAMVGKYFTPRGTAILDTLDEVAAATSAKPAEVALAWIIAREGVTAPIASSTSLKQLESFARAAELTLSADQIAALNNASAVTEAA